MAFDLASIFDAIGAGAGAIGSISSAFGDDDAENVSREQLAYQKMVADRIWQLATAKRTDARGNVTGYDSTDGFYTNLTPSSQGLLSAQDAENYLRLTRDMQLRREGLEANALRRGTEGQAADEALAELRFGPRYNADSIIADLVEAATTGVNRGYDDAGNAIMRTGLRTGDSTSSGAALADIASKRAKDLADSRLQAKIAGPQLYEQLESARTGRGLSSYNTLASRASNFEDVPFQPSGIDVGAANVQAQMPGAALGASQLGQYGVNFGNLINTSGSKFDPNMFAGGLDSLMGAFQTITGSGNQYVPSNRGLGDQAATGWHAPRV